MAKITATKIGYSIQAVVSITGTTVTITASTPSDITAALFPANSLISVSVDGGFKRDFQIATVAAGVITITSEGASDYFTAGTDAITVYLQPTIPSAPITTAAFLRHSFDADGNAVRLIITIGDETNPSVDTYEVISKGVAEGIYLPIGSFITPVEEGTTICITSTT